MKPTFIGVTEYLVGFLDLDEFMGVSVLGVWMPFFGLLDVFLFYLGEGAVWVEIEEFVVVGGAGCEVKEGF